MAEATLSSKNQIVIPREAREALGLRTGVIWTGDLKVVGGDPIRAFCLVFFLV
jgi:bifunctional DNA-binding transcriptional regulator/antitoxin component of YhaV-PrlF toxin-antitoxin module